MAHAGGEGGGGGTIVTMWFTSVTDRGCHFTLYDFMILFFHDIILLRHVLSIRHASIIHIIVT